MIRGIFSFTLLGLVCAAVLSATALAAIFVRYQDWNVGPFGMGNDFTVVYRNFNDACSRGTAEDVRAIYSTSGGSWIAYVVVPNTICA